MYETVGDTITALYICSATGTLQAVKWNGSYYYYHYNAHGDVTGVTNSTGSVYRQYFYDPYGNLIKVQDGSGAAVDINTDSFNHAYTYAGYRYDQETGLYFLNARYYAPEIGRFLTKDTWKGTATDPGTLNRYAYTHGDPVNYIDTNGHRPDVTGGPESVAVYNSASEEPYKSVIQTGYSSSSQDNGVNNANKLLLGTVGAIVDAEIGKIATGTAKKALTKVGPVGGLGLVYDLASDSYQYSNMEKWYAMTLTGIGFIGTIVGTAILTAILFPAGATVFVTVAVAVAVSVPVGLGINWIKRRTLSY